MPLNPGAMLGPYSVTAEGVITAGGLRVQLSADVIGI